MRVRGATLRRNELTFLPDSWYNLLCHMKGGSAGILLTVLTPLRGAALAPPIGRGGVRGERGAGARPPKLPQGQGLAG